MRRLCFVGLAMSVMAAACSGDLGMPPGATRQSQSVLELWRIAVFAGAGVGLVVYALLAWVLIRYRRRRDDDVLPVQTREHRGLEITYTVVPIVIVVALFVAMVPRNQEILAVSDTADVVVEVEAFDWSWRFAYPGTRSADGKAAAVVGTPQDPPVIQLPVGSTVLFKIRSGDVAHSFYIPGFLFKLDAIPGRENQFEVALTETGTYNGQCAEFCGLDHARMRFSVDVVEPADFQRWLGALGASTTTTTTPRGTP